MLPLVGTVTTAMLVTVPVICAVRSMAVGVENPTTTDLPETVGPVGNTVMLTGGEGGDVPPAPVAV